MSWNTPENPENLSISAWQMFRLVYAKLNIVRSHHFSLFFLLFLFSATKLVDPYFYKIIVDGINTSINTQANTDKTLPYFLSLIWIWILFACSSIVLQSIYNFFIAKYLHIDWMNHLLTLSKNFISLPLSYHISVDTSEKVKILDRGAESLYQVGEKTYGTILPQIIIFCCLLLLGFQNNITMMLIILFIIPLGISGVYFMGKTSYAKQKEANLSWDKSFGHLGDVFLNISILKLFTREKHEDTRLHDFFQKSVDNQLRVNVFWIGFGAFLSGFSWLGRIATLGFGSMLALKGQLTIGEVFMFESIAAKIYSPVGEMFQAYQSIVQSSARYSRAEETNNLPKESVDEGLEMPSVQKSFSFDNVSFSYPSTERQVLKNISFEVKKGQKVAFIGHTGAGKTTIAQLLMRFYKPTSGSICIDGQDISAMSLASFRHKFATVFQDTTLFNDTIRANLLYVSDSLTQEDIENACKKAQIYDFIIGLEKGFDTIVGERGLKLSGGEKQRLAIARAILANPEILILDEATSALDSQTERGIQKAFEELMEGRTSFVIAHRLSTIRSVDIIFLLENGEIIANGSHQELLEKSPLYQEMVNGQNML